MHLVIFQLQMEMRTSRGTGRTDFGYLLPDFHGLSLGDHNPAAVCIEGFYTVSMVHLKIHTIGIILSNILHRSGRKGSNRVTHLSSDIYAAMKMVFSINRVVAIAIV